MSKLNELDRRYKDQGLVLVGIFRGESSKDILNELKDLKIDWPVGFDSQLNTFQAYFPPDGGFVSGSPYYAFIDKNSKRRDYDSEHVDLESMVKKLLKESIVR